MPKSSESINISGEDEEKVRSFANNYAWAVRQTTFRQEKRQGHVFFFRKKQQGDRDHSGVNQSKTIKPAMLIN